MKNLGKLQLPVRLLCVILSLTAVIGTVWAQSEQGQPGVLRNPLNPRSGADPWLTYYEGNYYLTATTGASELLMRKSPTLAGLKSALPVLIYSETEPSRCCNMWAPEFHLLDGPDGPRWYYYYSAGTIDTLDNQHTHVLESAGTDPMGPYTYKARIFDAGTDVWAIDGSVLLLNEKMYFLFSSWVADEQSLFIAPMSDPWTISGPRVMISRPELEWERRRLNVNEGPVALQHEDDTFIVYSASFCAGPDYALGLLTFNGGDPLSPDSWVKSPEPIFERSDENGVFGPAHNGFFRSPDGTENWIVYHANSTAEAGCDDRRTTRVQRFSWNEDGTPNLGTPVATTEEIAAPSGDLGVDPIPEFEQIDVISLRSFAYESAFLRRVDRVAAVEVMIDIIPEAQFYVVPGLADPTGISLMSITLPGYYLRHQGNSVVFSPDDGSPDYVGDATWMIRPGLADETWISLESYNAPGRYIGRMFGVTALFAPTESSSRVALEDATFLETR